VRLLLVYEKIKKRLKMQFAFRFIYNFLMF
jgi:hypothetical protein